MIIYFTINKASILNNNNNDTNNNNNNNKKQQQQNSRLVAVKTSPLKTTLHDGFKYTITRFHSATVNCLIQYRFIGSFLV